MSRLYPKVFIFFFSNRQEVMMLWYVFFFIVPSSFRLIIEDKIPWSLKLIVKETGDIHKRQLYAEIKSRLQASCSWHNISIYKETNKYWMYSCIIRAMQITTMEIRPQQQQLLLIYFDLYSVSSKLDELPLYIFYYIAEGQKKQKKNKTEGSLISLLLRAHSNIRLSHFWCAGLCLFEWGAFDLYIRQCTADFYSAAIFMLFVFFCFFFSFDSLMVCV